MSETASIVTTTPGETATSGVTDVAAGGAPVAVVTDAAATLVTDAPRENAGTQEPDLLTLTLADAVTAAPVVVAGSSDYIESGLKEDFMPKFAITSNESRFKSEVVSDSSNEKNQLFGEVEKDNKNNAYFD